MSSTSSARFETAVAPTIVVMTANRPERTLKPSHAPTSAPARAPARPIAFASRRPLRVEPGQEDAEADRQPDRERGEQLVVERHRRQRRQRDQRTDEPAAEAENEHVDRADRGARLRAEPAAPPDTPARARAARPPSAPPKPSSTARMIFASVVCGNPGVEVDAVRRVARGVDPAAVEERVHEVRARLRLVAPEVVGVPEAGQDDLVAVRQVGQELRVAVCGGVAKSRLPPISSVSTLRVPHASSTRSRRGWRARRRAACRRPRGSRSPGLPRIESRGRDARRSSAARSGRRCAPPRRTSPLTCVSGKTSCDSVERSQSAARVALRRRRASSRSSCGAAIGAAASVECIRPKNGAEPRVARLDPQEAPAAGNRPRGRRGSWRRGRSSGSCTTSSPRAERGVLAQLLVGRCAGTRGSCPGGLTPTITERWMLARVAARRRSAPCACRRSR